jgi:hypothetical protein
MVGEVKIRETDGSRMFGGAKKRERREKREKKRSRERTTRNRKERRRIIPKRLCSRTHSVHPPRPSPEGVSIG